VVRGRVVLRVALCGELPGVLVERRSIVVECPSCGEAVTPDEVIRCAERITFYSCPECDFSTWDAGEFSEVEEESFTPDEYDAYIYDAPRGYGVTFHHKHVGTYARERQAEAAVYLAMIRSNYFPNVWRVNDHGNMTLCYFDSHVLRFTDTAYV